MSDTDVKVVPKEYIKSAIITNLKIQIGSLNLFKSVAVSCILFNELGEFVDSKLYTLTGSDYDDWGNDDNYIEKYCLDKLGMTKIIE